MFSWTTLWHLVPTYLVIALRFATIVSGARCVHEEPFELASRLAPTSLLIICGNRLRNGMQPFSLVCVPFLSNGRQWIRLYVRKGRIFACDMDGCGKGIPEADFKIAG